MQVSRETFLAVCSQYPQFLQIGSKDGEEEVSSALQDCVISGPPTIASKSSTSSVRRLSVDTAWSSIGSSTSSLQRSSLDTSPTSPLVQSFMDSVQVRREVEDTSNVEGPSVTALTIRRACRYDCFCKCHVQNAPIQFKALSRIKSRNQCTEPSCQGARSPGGQVVTPSTFFRKAISQVMSSKSIKVRYDLNSYRMVSEGSDAMRYVKHGNLEKLKACIMTGDATLWDTAPDGWSLLHVSSVVQMREKT